LPFFDQAVNARRDQERDELHAHAADAGDGHWLHNVRAAAMGEEDGHQTDDGRRGGHQHRPDSFQSGLDHQLADFRDAVWMLAAERVLQKAADDDAGVVGHAEQDNEAHPHGNAQIRAIEQQERKTARRGDKNSEKHDECQPPLAQSQVDHHEHGKQHDRNQQRQPLRRPLLILELAAPFPVVTGRQHERRFLGFPGRDQFVTAASLGLQ